MSRLFIDTNVLIYAVQGSSRFHLSAREALRRADGAGDQLWISRQVVREYLSVMTRPSQIVPYDPILPRAEAIGAARALLETFWVAEDGPEVMDRLFDLVGRFSPAGRKIHDANIVATMLTYEIGRLLTFNVGDFRYYSARRGRMV